MQSFVRNEREFAGYRDATDMLMRFDSYEPLSVPFVLHLHRLLFDHAGGKGGDGVNQRLRCAR